MLGGGAVAALAGCESTTTPVAVAGAGRGGDGLLGDATAGGPVDALGIPLARRDYPVRLPRTHDAVAASVKPERGGELRVYNYADYLNPAVIKEFGRREGVSVRVTTFDTLDEAFAKLQAGLEFDVVFSTPDQLSRLVGREHVQPLNPDLVPNLQRTVWPELRDPPYDVDARYSVPYVTYSTGIGWRNDVLDYDPSRLDQPWDALWRGARYRGRVAVLDDRREGLGMALLRRGVPNLNTEDPALIRRALADLEELKADVGVKTSISDYETLPAGRTVLHESWSGDLISAVLSYLPAGTKGDVLSYWAEPIGGPIYNDVITVAAKARKPVMAHRFLDYLMDDEVAYANFSGYVGYQPPLTSIGPTTLFDKGVLPASLRAAVVSREDYARGNAYLGLTAKGDQLWDTAWQSFRTG